MNLSLFNTANLFEAATNLFQQLGIKLNSNTAEALPTKDLMKSFYKDNEVFNSIKSTYFIGIIDDSVFQATGMFDVNYSIKEALQQGNKNYDGLMLFALELTKKPTRTEISEITRAFNRISQKMPVALVLKYTIEKEAVISIAISERFKYLQNWRQGEKVGKVIILRDIFTTNTHAGHQRILLDLVKPAGVANYAQLHAQWLEVLDVNILNKKFFQELANWYFWAMDKVQFPDDIEKKKDVRNATNLIRLITRVIFIWFIKEKHLVPDYLFNEKYLSTILKDFLKNKKSANYYQAILQNLFFGTLNQKMDERDFAEDHNRTNKLDQGIKNKYRYADKFNISKKEIIDLFKDIPFLNGGLFDCLDKFDEEKLEKGKKEQIFVDGFTRLDGKQAIVPDYLFFGVYPDVDLTEYYDPEAKKPIVKNVKGLIDILKNFKFTVAENTPIEEEIALDPELLGKVFENLLASYNPETKTTARKQTGSFYTPREIVNYMVDESLIEYLKQNTEIKTNDFDSRLRNLFSYNDEPNPFNPKETDQLIEAINNAKILDPACGSGAFPMGILHKMVHLLQKLDPGNVKWKEQQKEKIIGNQIKELEKDKKAIEGLSDKAVREKAIKAVDERLKEIDEIFESKNNFDDYARKLYLIENCIYGIDIQPIAVQISKLRFFISLIIDQDKDNKKENLGFRSLPNLETKFVAANTLISLEIPTTDLFSENNPIKLLQEQLKATRHEYFNAKTRKEKLYLQQQDKELRKKIAAQISDTLINKKEKEIANLEKQLEEAKKKLIQIENGAEQKEIIENTNIFGETETTVIDKKKEKIKAQKSTISFIEKQINSLKATDNKNTIQKVAQQISSFDPYDQNTFANWFEPEWMFGTEVKDGFDIVIGNPPYVDSETMTKDNPEFRKYLKSKFQSAEGNWDLFVVFTEMGLKLCKRYGSLAFIVPNKIISAKYTYSLRTIICNLSPREIIDYSYVNVFKEADVYPVVILISNQETHKYQVSSKVMYNLEEIKTINLINSIQFTSDIFWDKYFFNPDVVNLIIKITSNDKLISKFPNILGAATVNEAYQVKEVIKELEKEKKYFKFINTGTIDPYKSLWGLKQTQYIKGNYHKPIITKTDLDEINRTRTKQSSSPKIIIAGMALRIEAFYDEYGSYYAGKSTTIILGESQSLKTLTGIINSKLVSYWFSKYFNSLSMAGGYFNIGNNELGLIPLPNMNFPNNQINNIVDKILVENSNNPQADTSSLEKQIDELVYKLYDLTEEEIAIIENSLNKT
ncbi:MAG: hypothetical protein GX220_02610 [Treponema sp.]|nr:hypothetical protein [Treponema sp.]